MQQTGPAGTGGRFVRAAAVLLLLGVLIGTPIAAGGVHRFPMSVVVLAAGASVALLAASTRSGRTLRVGRLVALPGLLLGFAVLQSIPLPRVVRDALDPAGGNLLTGAPGIEGAFPLSLDPPATRIEIGKAAAAVAIFIVAYHLAGGRRRRSPVISAVAVAGMVALTLGVANRILGDPQTQAPFAGGGFVLGPLVNRNHTAELLELSAFAALACALGATASRARVGWLVAALLLGVGALGTFSRGSVLALTAGGLLFVIARRRRAPVGGRRTRILLWAAVAGVLVVLLALTLGVGGLARNVAGTQIVDPETKLRVQLDSWRVIRAHPAGVGRAAFDRVYPVYSTLDAPVRFEFIENELLQILAECGWLGLVAVMAVLALGAREVFVRGRRDGVEAALVGGVAAILAHNLVDFGLEVLGIALPFSAVLGALAGRLNDPDRRTLSVRPALLTACAAAACTVVGTLALWSRGAADFDALILAAPSAEEQRALSLQAQAAHPVDYYYALAEAVMEPLLAEDGKHSPRLHALNRAMQLRGGRCFEIHREAARTLWALGLRRQAVGE